jgi:PAS domain S-box-containing protein
VSESLETQRRTKDGRTREIWLTMTVLRDASGRPDAIVTTDRDVTELKEGLAAKQAARLFQQVIEDLPAGAVVREGDRLTLNRAAEAITGYRRRDLSTMDAWCLALHGDQASECRPLYETSGSLERGAQPVRLEIARKDGTPRHVEFTICRLDDTHELWMLLDVTEHDRAERALRRSEDYLRSIVNTAVDAIITINRHGTIETFNLAAERMFGYAAAEVVGQNVRLLMPQPYRDEHDGYLARYVRTGEARIIGVGREVVGQRKDGTTFPLDLAISQIDHLHCFTGILRDLTDRRKLEWRLAESQAEERRHVARELHDGMGGHMTGIGLLAQTLQTHLAKGSSPLAAKAKDLVRSIDGAQKQLRSIVRELMPVEAIEEGLMAALQELATQAETQYGLRCHFRCERPVYLDDPVAAKHVLRIVQEAVNNSVRHGKPTHITISLEQVEKRLEVAVSDDGDGLKETQDGQPGIGLESMRQRAHLLGGDLSVQPRKDGGTVVRCWMPLAPATPDAPGLKHRGKG